MECFISINMESLWSQPHHDITIKAFGATNIDIFAFLIIKQINTLSSIAESVLILIAFFQAIKAVDPKRSFGHIRSCA